MENKIKKQNLPKSRYTYSGQLLLSTPAIVIVAQNFLVLT